METHATGPTDRERDRSTGPESERPQRRRIRVLVSGTDYRPGERFRVIGTLPASVTVRFLSRRTGGRPSPISQPDEYRGYVVRMGPPRFRRSALVYARGRLRVRGRYRMLADVEVFSPELNLLAVTVVPVGRRGRRSDPDPERDATGDGGDHSARA